MEIYNYLGGRGWYPDDYGRDILERHTGTIELTMPDKLDARAMGQKVEETDEGRTRHQRWVVEKPTFMITFALAERPASYDLEVDGAPPIEVFGPGMGKEAKFHNVAADTANSLRFFSDLFDMPLETDHMEVASIAAGHGQSFDGFIHMSEGTFYLERPGASELFRAHEVAHQWWGHRVSWATYRDQWLSEAFAEYSAMMYVQATMENGEHWFGEILDTYNNELNGSIQSFLSKFARPGLTPLNPNERAKMGPIGLGYRAYSELTPGAYFAQTYQKGALVLHMLRVMLRNMTKSDDLFVKVLSDFLHEYDGKAASTQDFINVLSRDAPGHWKWFFDQWVYGTAIPTYKWDWKTVKGGDAKHPYVLQLTVRQEGVPDGFRMPVPIRIDFGRAGSGPGGRAGGQAGGDLPAPAARPAEGRGAQPAARGAGEHGQAVGVTGSLVGLEPARSAAADPPKNHTPRPRRDPPTHPTGDVFHAGHPNPGEITNRARPPSSPSPSPTAPSPPGSSSAPASTPTTRPCSRPTRPPAPSWSPSPSAGSISRTPPRAPCSTSSTPSASSSCPTPPAATPRTTPSAPRGWRARSAAGAGSSSK